MLLNHTALARCLAFVLCMAVCARIGYADSREEIAPLPSYAEAETHDMGVNLATGLLTHSSGVDLSVYNPVGPSVAFSRLFSSYRVKNYPTATNCSAGLSPGWMHGYDITLKADTAGVLRLYNPDGAVESLDAQQLYGAPYKVTRVDASTVEVLWRDRTKQYFTAAATDSSLYILRRIYDPLGHYITLNWNDTFHRLESIACGSAVLLTLSYRKADGTPAGPTEEGRLGSLQDCYGRKVTYAFANTYTGLSMYCLQTVSQVVPISAGSAAMRYTYGYRAFNDNKPRLITVSQPESVK